MANLVYSGSAYIDTTGVVYASKCKVSHIFFTPATNNDTLTIYDSSTTTDNIKLFFQHGTNKDTEIYNLDGKPLVFQNGIYVTITAGAKATLVFTSEGAST